MFKVEILDRTGSRVVVVPVYNVASLFINGEYICAIGTVEEGGHILLTALKDELKILAPTQ